MRYRLAPGVTRRSAGRVLIGGSPLRLLRLSEPGAAVVDALEQGRRPPQGVATERFLDRLAAIDVVVPVGEDGDPMIDGPVDVVVPVRDDLVGLERTLAALAATTGSADLRLVVVDDGSADAAAVASLAADAGARLVRNERALGPGGARQEGAGSGDAPWIAFVDAGVVPPPDWLVVLGRHLVAGAAAVAPRIASAEGPTALERYEATDSPLDLGPHGARVRPGSRRSYVPTALVAVSRAGFEEVGGFDTALRYGEDVDLVWRLDAAGASVRYVGDELVAFHPPRRTWPAVARQRFRYGTAAAALDRRHPHAAAPAVVSRWTLGVWALALAGRPVAAGGLAAGTGVALARRLRLDDRGAGAARLVVEGHLGGARALLAAAVRPWWPVSLLLVACSRRARRLAPLLLVPPVLDLVDRRRRGHPRRLDPIRWLAARLLDDVAYGAGVWAGAIRERSVRALLPRLVEWPGRSTAGPQAAADPTRQN